MGKPHVSVMKIEMRDNNKNLLSSAGAGSMFPIEASMTQPLLCSVFCDSPALGMGQILKGIQAVAILAAELEGLGQPGIVTDPMPGTCRGGQAEAHSGQLTKVGLAKMCLLVHCV